MKYKIIRQSILFSFILLCSCIPEQSWQEKLETVLSEYGHRNWIVVADYAYPSQSADGLETIFTGEDHLAVLTTVMEQIELAPHIRPKVMIDRELEYVSDQDAPGIERYRSALGKQLNNMDVTNLPHERIISRLDSNSKMFNILVLKTNMILPYTSVFFELDCGYWDAESEKRLRDTIDEN